jgi:hypothetical protein
MSINRKILLGTLVVAAVLIGIAVWSWQTNGPAGIVNVIMGGWVGHLLTQVRRHKLHLKRLQNRLDVLSPYEDRLHGIGAVQQPPAEWAPATETHNYIISNNHLSNNGDHGIDPAAVPSLPAVPTLATLAVQPNETIRLHAARILERIRQWRQIGIISERTETQMLLVHANYAGGQFAFPTVREELRRMLRADGSTSPSPLRGPDNLDEAMLELRLTIERQKPEDHKLRPRERSVQL